MDDLSHKLSRRIFGGGSSSLSSSTSGNVAHSNMIVLWVRRFSIPRRESARGGNDGMVLAPLPSSFGRVVRCSVDDDVQISIFSILARVRSRFPSLRTLLWITKRKMWDDLFQTGMGENVKRSDVQSTAPLQCDSYEFSPGMMLPRIRINGRPNNINSQLGLLARMEYY